MISSPNPLPYHSPVRAVRLEIATGPRSVSGDMDLVFHCPIRHSGTILCLLLVERVGLRATICTISGRCWSWSSSHFWLVHAQFSMKYAKDWNMLELYPLLFCLQTGKTWQMLNRLAAIMLFLKYLNISTVQKNFSIFFSVGFVKLLAKRAGRKIWIKQILSSYQYDLFFHNRSSLIVLGVYSLLFKVYL